MKRKEYYTINFLKVKIMSVETRTIDVHNSIFCFLFYIHGLSEPPGSRQMWSDEGHETVDHGGTQKALTSASAPMEKPPVYLSDLDKNKSFKIFEMSSTLLLC